MSKKYMIRDLFTDEIVHTVDMSHMSERNAEKAYDGLIQRVDFGRFYIDAETAENASV